MNRRSGSRHPRMLRVPPRSSSPYRFAHHMRTLPPGHRPGVELFWRKLILEEITLMDQAVYGIVEFRLQHSGAAEPVLDMQQYRFWHITEIGQKITSNGSLPLWVVTYTHCTLFMETSKHTGRPRKRAGPGFTSSIGCLLYTSPSPRD